MKQFFGLLYLLLIILIELVSSQKKKHHHISFNYLQNGDDWKGTCAQGFQQSPINFKNIPHQCDKNLYLDFQPIDKIQPITIDAKHHSIGTNALLSKLTATTIYGEQKNYESINMHLHTPSEHLVNGQQYELELHIVHQLIDFPQGKKPKRDKAVVGIFFQVDDTHPHKDQFFNQYDLTYTGTKSPIDFNLRSALKSVFDRKGEYLAYEGSLTTPGCGEIVNWYVFLEPIPISIKQYEELRSFFTDRNIFKNGNNRSVQPLNGRMIKKGCRRKHSTSTQKKSKTQVSPAPSSAKSHSSHHSFDYLNNGEDWTGTCAQGHEQSPIDFRSVPKTCDPAMSLKFKPINQQIPITISTAHHALGSNGLFSNLQATNIDGQLLNYHAINMHIHTPSEHTFQGQFYDLELHIVHTLNDKHIKQQPQRDKAVTALLFQVDDSHPLKDQFFNNWDPANAGQKAKFNFNLDTALNGIFQQGEYLAYEGSLTTPGCNEIVNWYVFTDPIPISSQQLTEIKSFFSDQNIFTNGNNRATVPLNNRIIKRGGCIQKQSQSKVKTKKQKKPIITTAQTGAL